jgi:hypothetical protein
MNFVLVLNYVIQLLNGFIQLAPLGSALYSQLTADKAKFQQWADSNYVPTDADWQALHDAMKPLSDAIDARAAQP